jgi:metallo-beta-lactamase class B
MRKAWPLILLMFASPAVASEPFRVIANVFSVGVSDNTVFVVATPKGLVLIDSGAPGEYDKIRANMKKLGFDYYDIRIILLSQAQFEHAGNLAQFRRDTGARLMAEQADVPLLARGDRFPPVDVDQSLGEADRVTIGGLIFTAHITPGQTKGCTTWTTQVRWERTPYDVVFVGCKPEPGPDAKKTIEVLRGLKPDVFLGARGSFFNLEGKYARRGVKPNPFIDPDGYRKFVDELQKRFK